MRKRDKRKERGEEKIHPLKKRWARELSQLEMLIASLGSTLERTNTHKLFSTSTHALCHMHLHKCTQNKYSKNFKGKRLPSFVIHLTLTSCESHIL